MAEKVDYNSPSRLKQIMAGESLSVLIDKGMPNSESALAKEMLRLIGAEELPTQNAANIYYHFLNAALNTLRFIRDSQVEYMGVEKSRFGQQTIALGIQTHYPQAKSTSEGKPLDHLAKRLHTPSFDEIFMQMPEITMVTIRSILEQATTAEDEAKTERQQDEIREIAEEKASHLGHLHHLLTQGDMQTKSMLEWMFNEACIDAQVHFLRQEISDAVENSGEAVLKKHPEILAFAKHHFLQ